MEPHCLQRVVPWSLDTCSTQRSPVHRVQIHGGSNRDTLLYTPHNISSVYLTTTPYVRRSGRIINGMRFGRTIRLDRLHTGVGRFRYCLHKRGMASSAACECGTEEQTVDHVVLQCPIHRPRYGLHGLTVLDDETTEWLLNTCPEIECGQAVVRTTISKE